MSAPATIADDIVAEINDGARPWAGQVTAERTWDPEFGLDSATGTTQLTSDPILQVLHDSIPEKIRSTRGPTSGATAGNSVQLETHNFYFLLQCKPVSTSNEDIDPLVALLEQITDYFFEDGHAVGSLKARCLEAEVISYCDPNDLHYLRVYAGCVSLKFKAGRQ